MVQPEPISFHSLVQPSRGIDTVTDVGVGAGVTKAKIESRVLAKGAAGDRGVRELIWRPETTPS